MTLILISTGFIISAIISSCVIPKVQLLSLKKRLVDNINNRKSHTVIASRLGGIVFFPIIFICSSLCISFASLNNEYLFQETVTLQFLFESCAIFIIYLVGTIDDIIGVRYKLKFIFQIISAALIVVSGTYFHDLYGFLGIEEIPAYVGMPLTVFVIVFITNAINLIDGIDGLASLLSMTALLIYGLILIHLSHHLSSLIVFVTIGTLFPFFYYNVFRITKKSRSKIFMGDSGSLTIGMILSIIAIKLWNIPFFFPDSPDFKYHYVLAYTMLIIPSFDVVRVMLFRTRKHKPIFKADNSHIHHKFMELGLTHRKALLIIFLIMILFLIINLSLINTLNSNKLVVMNIIIWTIIHAIINRIRVLHKKSKN